MITMEKLKMGEFKIDSDDSIIQQMKDTDACIHAFLEGSMPILERIWD